MKHVFGFDHGQRRKRGITQGKDVRWSFDALEGRPEVKAKKLLRAFLSFCRCQKKKEQIEKEWPQKMEIDQTPLF